MENHNLKDKTKIGFYWKFFEQFTNYGLQFFIGIILARLLSPSDYGIIALPSVFLAVANVFVDSGFFTALVRKEDMTERDLCTSFYYSIGVGLICYLLIFIGAPWIADFYNTPVLKPLVRVTALSFLWGPLNTPQYVILTRRLDFKTISKVSVITKVVGSVLGIVCAYIGLGLWSLVIMGVVSSFLSFVQLWISVKWLPRQKWSNESFKYLWNYGNKLLGSSLLDRLYQNIVPVFVGKYYSPYDLGLYNRAANYANLPSQNITGVIQSVTFPVLSKMQSDDDYLKRNYLKMIRTTAFVIFPLMLMLAALARPLVMVMITAKWEGCIILLQLLCFSMMWYPIHAMNLSLLQVKGRSDIFFKLEVIKKVFGAIVLLASLPVSLVVVILGSWVTNIFSLVVNTYYTGKIIGATFLVQMQILLPTIILSLLTWGVILLVNHFVGNYYLQIVVGVLLGFSFYLGCAKILNLEELEHIKYFLSRKNNK